MDTLDTESLFTTSSLEIVEMLKASEIPNKNDIDNILLKKIKDRIGDKCIQNGFIKKNSINIISRTIGIIKSEHFNGTIHYNVKIGVDLCSPSINSIVKAKVFGINQAGILCINEPLHIMLSPETQDNVDIYQDIKKGDIITIKIIRFKIMLNNSHIRILGKYIDKN